jgi:hypothetical protein
MTVSTTEFIEELAGMAEGAPERAEVLSLRRLSVEEVEARMRRLLSMTAGACGRSGKEGDWVRGSDHTLVRLPNGARAVGYHASGAMSVTAGLEPMDRPFGPEADKGSLSKQVFEVADGFELDMWLGRGERLEFERLWQIKAAAADPRANAVEATTVRAVGAYRHVAGELPVWGAASASVKIASGPSFDALTVQVRPTTGDVVDVVPILPPEEAAKAVARQLSGLVTGSKSEFADIVRPTAFMFGYFSHGKRKTQNYLAPAYVAMVRTEGEERFNYLAVVGGSEKEYVSFCRDGMDPSAGPTRPAVAWPEQTSPTAAKEPTAGEKGGPRAATRSRTTRKSG